MPQTQRIRLTSMITGESKDFESQREAGTWLRRSHAYVTKCVVQGKFPTRPGDDEMYVVTYLGPGKRTKGNTYKHNRTLCRECARASGNCSWSRDLTPVKGWEAEASEDRSGTFYTWYVISCPQYIADGKTPEECRKIRRLMAHG